MSEEKFTFFWHGPFSQWHPCKFTVNGVEYNCAEQVMMAAKATIFGDTVRLAKIMEATDPKIQKSLGRQVEGFNEERWNLSADAVVFVANYNKFNQNKDLLNRLLKTIGSTLVEASPYDKIWGIGLAESDPRSKNRATWLGQNRLGKELTAVRDKLISEFHEAIQNAKTDKYTE